MINNLTPAPAGEVKIQLVLTINADSILGVTVKGMMGTDNREEVEFDFHGNLTQD